MSHATALKVLDVRRPDTSDQEAPVALEVLEHDAHAIDDRVQEIGRAHV
jgi:hypothetical protein